MGIAILSLGLLFVHATSITPRDVRIADIGGDDAGLPVRVRGHVHRVDTTDEGNAAIVLLDYEDFMTLRVIARPRAVTNVTQVAAGAYVSVVGAVFGSHGSLQVFSEVVGGVTVLAPPSSNLQSLEFVARNAARLDGHRVAVRASLAEVHALVDSRHARLRQGSDEMWAYDPSGWAKATAVITGRVYITSRGRCELFAGEEPDAMETQIAALAACGKSLLGRPVVIRDVIVEPGETLGTAMTLKDLGDGADYRMAAFVRGWDRGPDAPWMSVGRLVTIEGTVEYQATEARWRIVTDVPPHP